MLVADRVSKYFGARQALADVSFAIGKGEIVGFLGGNGAGKSTTMRLLAGFFAPSAGRVAVAGADPRAAAARSMLGYLPEDNPLPPRMRVREYLAFRAGLKGLAGKNAAAAVRKRTAECGLEENAGRLLGQLSKGMRQRVGLADALLGSPPALVLDEPTAGLDPRQAAETRELIARAGKGTTVLLSSHILSDIERLCARIIVLRQGRVAADGALETLLAGNARERTLRMELLANDPPEDAARALLAVPGVAGADAAPGEEGGLSLRATVAAGADPRRELAALCVRKGWLVTEMRFEPVRLEDVFRELTAAGQPPERK